MPFQPGQSGNPGGRVAVKPWQDALKTAMARKADGDYRLTLTKVAESVVDAALAGDRDAWKEIGDRMDGKPAQAIIGGDEQDNPLRVFARIERVITDPKA